MIDMEKMRRSIEWAREHPELAPVPPIKKALAPGGLVFHLLIDGKVARERLAPAPTEELTHLAEEDADLTVDALDAGLNVELRVYDGDSGGWVFSRQVFTE